MYISGSRPIIGQYNHVDNKFFHKIHDNSTKFYITRHRTYGTAFIEVTEWLLSLENYGPGILGGGIMTHTARAMT